jgi:hypothetical protein
LVPPAAPRASVCYRRQQACGGSVPRLQRILQLSLKVTGKSYDIIRRQRSSNGVLSKYINFSFDIVFASIILPKFKNDVSPIDPRCCAIVVFQSEPAVPTRY